MFLNAYIYMIQILAHIVINYLLTKLEVYILGGLRVANLEFTSIVPSRYRDIKNYDQEC